jgi:ubiquinone/menaquinone biosynthesis C-methylase UbiE
VEDYQLLIDLHKRSNRQGPGGDAETEMALALSMADRSAPLKIADIGCGTGASTLLLARLLNAQITAVDFLQEFLEVLEGKARKMGLSEKITTLSCSMQNLPFEDDEYDVIWSEGAIYNIGFKRGVKDWGRYLKVGGLLVVSEITWITGRRPSELQKYWDDEYPEIDVASSKFGVLEKNGYSPIGYFVLPEHCWLENYYRPMQNSFKDFLNRNGNSEEARAIVQAENREIKLYENYKTHYSYGVYIARKLDEVKA